MLKMINVYHYFNAHSNTVLNFEEFGVINYLTLSQKIQNNI